MTETPEQAAAYAAARRGDARVIPLFAILAMPCGAPIEGGYACSRPARHAPTGHVAEADDRVVAVSRA